ncbi:uncharacterized protein LOC122315527 [Carya illinoinensis]|nr:uncharacterized protein LOC122315527 [Carya illinoinensis]
MIPVSVLSKMCMYEIEIQGVDVKASVVDRGVLVDAHIAELRSALEKPFVNPLVTFDIKCIPNYINGAALLILCVGTRCLIVQLHCIDSFPESIKKFLSDENVCFVGMGVKNKVKKILLWPQMENCKTGVELGHLAARVLKKPKIDGSSAGLVELASEVGLHIHEEPKSASFSDWSARVFSHEQVKYAIHDACTCYMIADYLLNLL